MSPAPGQPAQPRPALSLADHAELPPLAQAVLAALALGAVPRPRGWVVDVLMDPALRPGSPQRPSHEQVRQGLQWLAEHCWAEQDLRRSGYWTVRNEGLSLAWAAVLDGHPPGLLREALARADGYSALHLPRHAVARVPTVEAALARMQLALLLGDEEPALQALLPQMPYGLHELAPLLEGVAGLLAQGLDEALLARLAPGLRARLLNDWLLQWCANWQALPRLDLLQASQQALAEDPQAGDGLLCWAVAEAALLSGRFGLLAQVLPERLGQAGAVSAGLVPAAAAPLRLAFAAAECCFEQDDPARWPAAEAVFEQAMQALRQVSGKKRGVLPALLGWTYALALLAQGTPGHWHKALKFCLAEGGKREPVLDSPFGFIALALRMRLGEEPLDLQPFRPYALGGQAVLSPLDLWRWLMRAWLKEGALPEPLSSAEAAAGQRLLARLEEAGLATLAGLMRGALAVLAAERPPAHFFIAAAKERWETALDALQAVAQPPQPAGSSPRAEASETRLIWVLELDAGGNLHGLLPFEQKLGQRGWGKPKEAPLARLQRTAEALPAEDAAVARCIRQETYGRALRLDLAAAAVALIGHPRLALDTAPEQFVELGEGHPELDVVEEGSRLRVRMLPAMQIHSDEASARWAGSAAEQKELDALRLINIVRDGPQRARLVRLTPEQKRVAQLLGPGGLEIPREGAARLQEVLTGLGSHFRIQSDDQAHTAQPARELPAESRLRAELSPLGDGLQLRLVAAPFGQAYAADGPRMVPGSGRARLVATLRGETLGVQRDLALEREHRDTVLAACPMLLPLPEQAPCEWALEAPDDALQLVERLQPLHALAALEWPQGKALRVDAGGVSQLSLRVHTRQEWLAVSGELQVDESLVLGLQQLIALSAGHKSRFVPLGEGRFLALTQELRERLDDLAAVAEAQRGADLAILRIPMVAAPWVQQASEGARVESDAGFARCLERLEAAQRVVPALPATLQAALRPYQEEGFEWAMRLASAGLGACLADDMGLGKTLQALAVLLARASRGPALVVAPTSLVGNWRAEARRFAPSLQVQVYAEGGAAGERGAVLQQAGKGSVVLVSYQMLQGEQAAFAERQWATLVLDEAQAIKNAAAKRSQAVFELKADFRLALSGTPIENRLAELWSIMRACNPGLLGSLARFNERFAGPIERQRDKAAQRQLRRLIAPFILRRTKAQVLDDLPPRTELVLKVQPEAAEVAHYEALRRDTLINAERSLAGDAPGQAHLNILAGLTRLRRAACDPRLVSPHLGFSGAKVQAFGELAAELVANGHKALVFSQFVDFLSLLKAPLDAAGIAYQYLDGSTPAVERTRRVDAFQAGEGDLFLISLKAGGFGLNLTVADYVVIADPWWNPAAEDQASGRAHRIGQQRPVTVYRLVSLGTLEEKILTLHHDKRELADLLLEGHETAAVPQAHELLALMRGENADGDDGAGERSASA